MLRECWASLALTPTYAEHRAGWRVAWFPAGSIVDKGESLQPTYLGHDVRSIHVAPSTAAPILLFSYGTLQDRQVQIANFGRELSGRADALPGYTQTMVAIDDPQVVATSGKTHHPIVEAGSDPHDEVAGTVFEITVQELAAADEYEVSDYRRIAVTLKSGVQAWVYVRA
jgi:Gamma-glutamyl cyclotransferase, AIG2-like